MLRLRDADELDDEVEKRDYGTWLHEVLQRFHAHARRAASRRPRRRALHRDRASRCSRSMALDDADFLPFAATFARFAPRYVAWLHRRDARRRALARRRGRAAARSRRRWDGVEMHGIIDRVDRVAGDDGPATELIDYKTGSAEQLRDEGQAPQEDTQLAFYAALMAQQSRRPATSRAMYLPLDEQRGRSGRSSTRTSSARPQQLVDGIGATCARCAPARRCRRSAKAASAQYCEARGLCRRDHWPSRGAGG